MLNDVLHYYYFPREENRRKLLQEIYRVLKPKSFLSFYPGDPEIFHNYSEMEAIKLEIKDEKFILKTSIHEDTILKGNVPK